MKSFVLTACILFYSCGLFAQTSGFLHYSVEDGLPQSQVTSLAQDKKGNLWAGTMSGCSRFDGKSFKTFNTKNGLAENWVTTLYTDHKGNIWAGHWSGGISIISSDGKTAKKAHLPGLKISGKINAISQTSDSVIWIATESDGLIRINLNTNKPEKYLSRILPSAINGICADKGSLILSCGKKLLLVNDCLSDKPRLTELAEGKSITSAVTLNGQVCYVDDGNLFLLRSNIGASLPLPATVKNIYSDQLSRLWVSTYGNGVYVFDKISEGAISTRTFTEREGLSFDFTNIVFQDQHQNIWIGTDLGLDLLASERFSLYEKAAGLSNTLIWSVLATGNGHIYAGSGDGLFVKAQGQHLFSKLNLPQLENKTIISLAESPDGSIWAGTMSSGLYVIQSNKVQQSYTEESGYPFERINRVDFQQDGTGWVATGQGVAKIHEGKIEWLTTDDGLLTEYVTTVYVDSKDRVWLGYTGNGLQCFSAGRLTVPFKDSSLSAATVLSITEDRLGNIWAGAFGDGLYVFDGQKVKNVQVNDGTNSDSPLSLAADKENKIWFGTNRGIDCFDPVTMQFRHYGKKRGFNGVETNINAITTDLSGDLWFGCLTGALRLTQGEETSPVKAPVPTIDQVQVYFKDAELPKDNLFKYEQNHLSFSFSSVYLKDPDKLRYQFMLEGFDKDWSPLTDKQFATYPDLSPGKYKFLVKSGFMEGVWSEPVEYSFEVRPPFWRTWWFNTLFIGTLTAFFMFLIEIKTRGARKSQKKLELLVRERTIELGQKNMELAKKNKELTELLRTKKEEA